MRRVAAAALALCTGAALAQQILRYAERPSAPPEFAADNPEGLIFAGVRTDGRHAWKRKVLWRQNVQTPAPTDPTVPRMNAAERQAMMQTLDALVAVMKATPTGSPGEGSWVKDSRNLGFVDLVLAPPGAPAGRWAMQFDSRFFPFYHEDVLRRTGLWDLSVNGETESVGFEFNRLPGTLQQPVIAEEAAQPGRIAVPLHLRPRVSETWAGWPVYESDRLVIARTGRDPWAPVALGRALAATLPKFEQDRATAEQRLAKLRRDNDEVQAPAWEQTQRDQFEKTNGALRETRPSNYAARFTSMEHYIRTIRAQSAAAAQPQRDAVGSWYWNAIDADGGRPNDGRYAMRGDLVPVGAVPGCREVVESNPAYFDLSLPRTTPQILVIGFGRCATVQDGRIVMPPVRRFDAPPQGCFRHRTMWSEADWRAIAALVVP